MRDKPILFSSNPSINHNQIATKQPHWNLGFRKRYFGVLLPHGATGPGSDPPGFHTGLGVQGVAYRPLSAGVRLTRGPGVGEVREPRRVVPNAGSRFELLRGCLSQRLSWRRRHVEALPALIVLCH